MCSLVYRHVFEFYFSSLAVSYGICLPAVSMIFFSCPQKYFLGGELQGTTELSGMCAHVEAILVTS